MSPFLLGVSLSLQDRALGGAYTFAHGEASGFFLYSETASFAESQISSEAACCSRPIVLQKHHPPIVGKSFF